MRKFLLTMLLMVTFATLASAQKEFANLDLPLRRAEDLVTLADDRGNVCIYFFQSNTLYFNLLSPTGEVLATHEIPYRYSQQPHVFGTRVTEDEFIFYSRYMNGRKEYVRPFAIHRENGGFRSIQDLEVVKGRNETFLGGFADVNHLYMLYSDTKNNLVVHRSSDYISKLEKKTFEDVMPKSRDRLDREKQLIFVHPDMDNSVYSGHHRSKIYTDDEHIYMIFDGYMIRGQGSKTTTEILTLNWNEGKSNYRTLPVLEQKGSLAFNSFLHQGKIFRVVMEKDKLNLTAYDFNTLAPLKEYNYTSEEEIAIKATPVYQKGAKGLFSADNTVIEKTSKVMKNLANGIPAITVATDADSTLQLTIGSYQMPSGGNRNQDLNRMVRTPDRYIQTSRGLMMLPGRWTPAYNIPSYYLNSPFYNNYFYDPYGRNGSMPTGPGTSTYFRAVLDSNTLNKVESKEGMVLLEDKLEKYEQELKPEPELRTVYRYGNKLHYGYYDRRSKTFKIVEFAKK
ncbi:hypothetical protein FVR03_00180 [Pontibacter qinzhouensis]|uniref:Uncharacterized protein n=1 Tax=Pontibacter qinzhouensis TaxID=2603253 RepID=A0A5C8KDM3_9BACT|nr:hypothetical protein [Pontibacter qinzhouensis]TXK52827.1 hypothetical protein FVR03_00180 [Pontibacter qinzhouensis]